MFQLLLSLRKKTTIFRENAGSDMSLLKSVFTWHPATILLFQHNEMAAMLVFQTNPVGVGLFSYVNALFVLINFHNSWHREWKRCIILVIIIIIIIIIIIYFYQITSWDYVKPRSFIKLLLHFIGQRHPTRVSSQIHLKHFLCYSEYF